jgi:hypothetical protein
MKFAALPLVTLCIYSCWAILQRARAYKSGGDAAAALTLALAPLELLAPLAEPAAAGRPVAGLVRAREAASASLTRSAMPCSAADDAGDDADLFADEFEEADEDEEAASARLTRSAMFCSAACEEAEEDRADQAADLLDAEADDDA